MSSKLVITYEGQVGGQGQEEYTNPPTFYDDKDYVVYAKGILVDREITFTRILEVYTTSVKYSAYEEGMKALVEDA